MYKRQELNHAKSEIQEMFFEGGYGSVTNLNNDQSVDSLYSHVHDEDHDKDVYKRQLRILKDHTDNRRQAPNTSLFCVVWAN